ncbi:MAG: AraC family transcriptional regulator, partial [Spirochaetales bacterium]|nr:AraC family transcriptional regulator [Spirochaetales bacterium]
IPAITIILILASKEQILNFHMSQTFSNEKIIYPAIFAAYLATYITLFFIAILKIILKNKSKISRKFAATISVIIILTILRDIFDFLSLYQIAGVFLTISIIVIFTKIITNPNIIELLGTELTKNHYRKSRLTNINIPETVEKIEKMMKEKKLYLDPNLKLPALAKKVGITTEQLSEIINLHYKNNFNQFINKFRINYAEELKSKFPEKKMLDIAYESGFNSSSSFYTAYKQQKEKNPRQKN